ncbi:MAG: helicase-related protein [Sulfurimonas sp.]|jgi:superfamily II DNA/RNA helicase|uniref:DEAD/DEAH box helicase n=1 Tax=Sulfurimonas sp. TaxID=2022749 RepID=UPI003567933F
MKKAIYKPTNQNTIIINEFDAYCEILLEGEYVNVLRSDIEFFESQQKSSSLKELKENIFLNCIKNPLSDILYSYNTNRLTPEMHQYKPLIKFLNSQNSRILIADEVGLGKTIEAGMIFKEVDKRHELKVSLIVVPSSLTLKWSEELEIRFDERFEIKKSNEFLAFIDEFDGYKSTKSFHEKIIISYHTLRDARVMQKLKKSFFEVDFLIMDEAHTMRNLGTTTFESAEIITAMAEQIVFLSATPVQNSLEDLFNILSLLDGDYFRDFDYFQKMLEPNKIIHKLIALLRNNHSLYELQNFVAEHDEAVLPNEVKNIFTQIQELQNITNHQKVYFIDALTKADHLSFIINRTKKKDVGRSIPRNAKSVIVEITEQEREYYQAVIEFVKFLNPSTPQGFITIMPERMASSSMIASLESFKEIKKSGKLFLKDVDELEDYYEDIDIKEEAMRYLDTIIKKGECIGEKDSKFIKFEEYLKEIKEQKIKQVIVFSFFKKTLNYLEVKLSELGYSVGKIHGDFSIEERYAKIKSFKKVEFDILLSSEVGSEGLDMQFCNVVVNYDLPWNPMRVEQRIGRIDRIGQKFDKLHIFNLCITGSIEDRIFNRLYSKLNIFEESIGELEPILGDLEKSLNLAQLITLSQEEIDKKLHLQELAIKRQELEIQEQNQEIEKLINDDFSFEEKKELFLNHKKIEQLQEQSREIFLDFLTCNELKYVELKDRSIKFSSENLKSLFNILRAKMSDKKTEPHRYNEQRAILQKMSRIQELKISFATNNNDEFQTLYLFMNHPLLLMITREKTHRELFAALCHEKYKNAYAIIYRADIMHSKPISLLKTLVLDEQFAPLEEMDYFEFITQVKESQSTTNTNPQEIKSKAMPHIIQSVEKLKTQEAQAQNNILNIKIESIKNYFDKQIARAQKLKQKVEQEDVQRMRIGEIENLQEQKAKKVQELESKKEIKSSFEILGVAVLQVCI